MLNIRSLTCFLNPGFPVAAGRIASAAQALARVKAALESADYPVQSVRLATAPFPALVGADADQAVRLAIDLEARCFASHVDYVSVGPARPTDDPDHYRILPDIIGATQNVFASALIAEPKNGVHLPSLRLAAEVIRRCAQTPPDGLGNLRFAVLANVPPGVPFFPAAYAPGGPPQCAVGVEGASLAVSVVAGAASLAEARSRLISEIESHAQAITRLVRRSLGWFGMRFHGLDFSFVPYPDEARSLGAALERLSGSRVGEPGTLAAAAFLADALDGAQYKRAGFSGLSLPVMEDSRLAQRAAEGVLTLSDLLLYAGAGGVGPDAVPLPGDTPVEALAAVLADVGALALRLNKPLVARLVLIPGKQAGDEVTFHTPDLAASRVLAIGGGNWGGLFAAKESVSFVPRRPRL
jgi:uncharacterized protein (UPF0210 family)